MARKKLTKRTVEAIQPVAKKDVVVWDSELPGFGVRVKPSGVRSYIVQYRNEHGRSRRGTIGRHGKLTLDQARKQAKQLFASVMAGSDPVSEKRTSREAPHMNDLLDRFIRDHVNVHNKPGTQELYKLIIRKHIRPALGKTKVAAVTRQDIGNLHRKMFKTPRQANLVLSVLSKMFNLAEVWGMRPDGSNPTRLIKRYPENRRERFCSDEELGRLWAALDRAGHEQTEKPVVIAAVILLMLTGCRLSEIIGLRWDDVNFKGCRLNIREAKAGGRWQTVGSGTMAFLADLPRHEASPWVLPHYTDASKHLPDYILKKKWRRIRKMAGLEDVRLHDLRHTVGTYAGQTGANSFLIRDKLGHKTIAMTNQYVNYSHDPQKQLSDSVEARILAARPGNNSGPYSKASPNQSNAEVFQLHNRDDMQKVGAKS